MKFNKIAKISVIAILIFSSTFACKKYPENPSIVLWTRESRIEGKWQASAVIIKTIDSTSAYRDHFWEFTLSQSVIIKNTTTKLNGFWTTGNSDKDFIIELDNKKRNTYQILKLTRKDFWLKDRVSEDVFKLKNVKY